MIPIIFKLIHIKMYKIVLLYGALIFTERYADRQIKKSASVVYDFN